MAKVLLVIAPNDYQDKEYGDTKQALESAGHTTVTTSTVEEAQGKFGGSAKADVLLKDAKQEDYDAVAFIGGPGCFQYFDNQTALSLAKDFFNANKLTCAICAAPIILANAGILEGKKATAYDGTELTKKGITYTGSDVEQDGLIITANGPMSASQFGETISKALS
jgi:protease I